MYKDGLDGMRGELRGGSYQSCGERIKWMGSLVQEGGG
jgi:hypothetical protein